MPRWGGRSAAAWLLAMVWGVAAADYEKGLDAFENRDYRAALIELQPLADQGDMRSQYLLGTMYRQGLLGVVDHAKAREWLGAAADRGHPAAQFSLGLMYFQGEIRPPGASSPSEAAADLFRQAAEQGHSDAQLYLGHLFADGVGVVRDRVEALKWYQLAAWQRNSIADSALKAIQEAMTPEQIAAGRLRARDWAPRFGGAGRS